MAANEVFAANRSRRERLVLGDNPRPGIDYVVSLGGVLARPGPIGERVTVHMRYVPDRHVIAAATFSGYLEALDGGGWNSLEELGVAILGDMNSELVPRWFQLVLIAGADDDTYSIMLEDRQPRWDNPRILGRLKPF